MVTATPPRGRSRMTVSRSSRALHLQRQHDGVDAFAAEGGVVHERRKRVADGVAGDAEDARGLVELVEAVEVEQSAHADLAGRGFFAVVGGGKGEGGAGARPEHAAEQALLAHGDADDVRRERAVFNELEHGEIVGQGAGGGNDFDVIGLEGFDARRRPVRGPWCG